MIKNKKFGEIVEEKMKEKKWTYDKLSKEANVSKTYLTDIIRKGTIPTISIIERIAWQLGVHPTEIKEYRVKKIFELIDISYPYYSEEDMDKIEKIVEKKKHLPTAGGVVKLSDKLSNKLDSTEWLDLSILPKNKRKLVIDLYEGLKKLTRELFFA